MSDFVDHVIDQWQSNVRDVDVSGMQVISRLFRMSVLASRNVEHAFKQHGLSQGEFDLLATLYRSGQPHQLSPQRLIDALLLSSGAMTNRLDRLEEANHIARQPNPDDRRSVLICLTPHGKQTVHAALLAYLDVLDVLLGPLNTQDQAHMAELLKKMLLPHDHEKQGGIAP